MNASTKEHPPLLHHTILGKGPTLVLLHGFCEDSEMWATFANSLCYQFSVITIDLPGFGKSRAIANEATLEYFADQIHEVLRHLSTTECVIIGHSMGGYTALAYAERYPEGLLGLGLFHSKAFADDAEKRHKREEQLQFLEAHGSEAFVRDMIPRLFAQPLEARLLSQVNGLVEAAQDLPPSHIESALIAMRDRTDRLGMLESLPFPVLFILGKKDAQIPLDAALPQCVLPRDSTVHILEDVAHMGMFEAPERTLKIVNAFAEYCFANASRLK